MDNRNRKLGIRSASLRDMFCMTAVKSARETRMFVGLELRHCPGASSLYKILPFASGNNFLSKSFTKISRLFTIQFLLYFIWAPIL